MSSLPSGVRLVRLLNEHLSEIMSRERTNIASIHLYCTGPYWVAFGALGLSVAHVFPDSEITPMRLLGYPFPVVMVSVTDRSLRSYTRKHILRRDGSDYKLLTVPGFPWRTLRYSGLQSFAPLLHFLAYLQIYHLLHLPAFR